MKERLLLYFFILILIIKCLESFVVYGHVDAINYHLVIAKYLTNGLWNEAWTTIPGALMSGVFEFIYLLPHSIFGHGYRAHSTSQFLHFCFSIGLGSITLYWMLSKTNKTFASLGAISILTISKGSSFFLYAKNDGVLALAVLLLYYFYDQYCYKQDSSIKNSIILGFLLGLAPAIKASGVLYIIPIALHFTYYNFKSFKFILISSSLSILTWLPILIRNYYYNGNPLFPGLIGHINGNSSAAMIEYYSRHMSSPATLQSVLRNIFNLFTGKLIFLIVPFIVFFNIFKKNHQKNRLFYYAISSFILILIVNGGVTAIRFLFPLFFVFVYFLFKNFAEYKFSRSIFVFLLVGILVDSKVDKSIGRVIDDLTSNETHKQKIERKIPLTKFWDKLDIHNSRFYILSDNLSQQYYAPINMRVIQYQHHPELNFLFKCKEHDLEKLSKYHYAVIMHDLNNPCYNMIKNSKLIASMFQYKFYKLK